MRQKGMRGQGKTARDRLRRGLPSYLGFAAGGSPPATPARESQHPAPRKQAPAPAARASHVGPGRVWFGPCPVQSLS
jgi:hypothetical protein